MAPRCLPVWPISPVKRRGGNQTGFAFLAFLWIFRETAHGHQQAANEAADFEGNEVQLEPARIQAHQIEQVVDELEQAHPVVMHCLHTFLKPLFSDQHRVRAE